MDRGRQDRFTRRKLLSETAARTEDLFLTPKDSRTADYIEGRYG